MRFVYLLIFLPFVISAQAVEVPDEMYFLGIKINIKNAAKQEIASSVALLKKNRSYYQTKLDRVDAYFPIIERIFENESVPDDFKFLVVQESALVADAVSKSNAVGFWQFKRESAIESGLRVDYLVDERKNISAATLGAAKYLKKSNNVFNNWIYTLQSYNVGLGGTQRSVDTRYYGATEMDIDGSTHWYIVKCIAHKLAFADEEGKNPTPPIFLFEYDKSKGKTWKDIAEELEIEESKLKEYNKWLQHHTIPDDKDYIVTIPATYLEKDAIAAKVGVPANTTLHANSESKLPEIKRDVKPLPVPKKTSSKASEMYPGEKPVFVLHNGLEAIKAKMGDDINKLAIQASISRSKFLKYNDLRIFDELMPNEYYYIESKNNKANVLFHIVRQGETLRDVSQHYGITISAILRKNRMKKGEPLQPGRELWLKNKRPEEIPVKIVPLAKPVVKTQAPKKHPVALKEVPIEIPKSVPIQTQPENKVVVKETPVLKPNTTGGEPIASEPTVSAFPKPTTLPTSQLQKISIKDTVHVVQPKESIYSIARLYNIRPDSIKVWNTIDSTGLKISQLLKIRKQVIYTHPDFILHTVAPSETIYRVADMYKVPVQKIQEWNGKTDFTLSVGEVIFIKKQP